MGIHLQIPVQLSLIGQSQSHGSKSAYCPRSRGLCHGLLWSCSCPPPCQWIWLQQVQSWLLLHRQSPQGIHKREAEPSYAPALAYHPSGSYGYNKYGSGYSYTDRSPQGIHKREADPSYAPALAYHPAGGYGYNKYGPGHSYTDRSPQGLHKREAFVAGFDATATSLVSALTATSTTPRTQTPTRPGDDGSGKLDTLAIAAIASQ